MAKGKGGIRANAGEKKAPANTRVTSKTAGVFANETLAQLDRSEVVANLRDGYRLQKGAEDLYLYSSTDIGGANQRLNKAEAKAALIAEHRARNPVTAAENQAKIEAKNIYDRSVKQYEAAKTNYDRLQLRQAFIKSWQDGFSSGRLATDAYIIASKDFWKYLTKL